MGGWVGLRAGVDSELFASAGDRSSVARSVVRNYFDGYPSSIHWLVPEIKWPVCEANSSPRSIVEVKNAWIFVSTLSIRFMA
jgi:hypothetical protein